MRYPLKVACALVLSAGVTVFAGCVETTPSTVPPPPPPDTTVYFYPAKGQSAETQDRDKYECNTWAVQQSGFDPSAPTTPPHLRIRVASGPPQGAGVAAGAIGGAALGTFLAPPWHAGQGALFGALAGAVIGGAAESSSRQRAQDQAVDSAARAQAAELEGQARNFRRAMSACLEARGYNVR